MSIIGIDFGKNIGLSIAVDKLAVPCFSSKSLDEIAAKILKEKAILLVVGWPLLLNGAKGSQCLEVESMLHRLLKLIGDIEFYLQDERFSSKFLHFQDNHASSAAWILQIFLDSGKYSSKDLLSS